MPKKWDSDATPSDKVFALFAILLFNNRSYSLTELTGENCLNASKATVGRLIRKLERSRIGNLKCEKRGKQVFYKLEKPARMPSVCMNADGLRQLALCASFLSGILPQKMVAEIDGSLNQAISYLSKDASIPANIGASLNKGSIDYTPFQDVLATLMDAIWQARICQVEYNSTSGTAYKTYNFAPKKILAYHECLYVDGWMVKDDSPERVYDDPLRLAVQRFRKCVLLDRSSSALPDVPLPDDKAMGIIRNDFFEVKIKFSPDVSAYVGERKWSEGQSITSLKDGSIILAANMSNVQECISWVLSFGDKAAVLEPLWLVTKIRSVIRRMAKRYSTPKKYPRESK